MTPDPEAKVPNIGYIGRIPVRNVWLLMLYASHLYQALPPARRVAMEKNPGRTAQFGGRDTHARGGAAAAAQPEFRVSATGG